MKAKLRTRRGETLTEVLVAVLVTAMAICLLAGMVHASMSINMQVRELDTGEDGFYPSLAAAETYTFGTTDTAIIVKTSGGPSTIIFADTYSHAPSGLGGLVVYGKEG